ncbi:class I SAM-dependent methyltransferase [Candidatus Uhrbacteria bacterium]|nr:class I SAM-dependent methyltransferase [Candidatus Uhrbacteria bacterium]
MSWFHEAFGVESEFNGKIECRRLFGSWDVSAGGILQSGEYITKMWKKAVRRVPMNGIKKILVLGLGAGGCLGPLHKRFPKSRITVVEIDPVMVGIAKRLKMYPADCKPEILLGDAAEILPRLDSKFDLIIWDLFVAGHTAKIIRDSGFVQKIAEKLERDGHVIVNYYREPEELALFDVSLSRHGSWKYLYNGLALYRHFGRGRVGEALPDGYVPYRGVRDFLERECGSEKMVGTSGNAGCAGTRWKHGPFNFEGYTSDIEPQIDPHGPRRLVIWQPITRTDKPNGWHRSWIQMNPNVTGFADLRETDPYWASWTAHAQRHRERWLKEGMDIHEITGREFLEAYRSPSVKIELKTFQARLVEKKIKRHGERMVFFGAFGEVGNLIAGLAALDIPEANQSVHIASFMLPETKRTSVGVGLVDAWFGRCLSRSLRFADFDLFWSWGDPWSWRGFSRFKGQFGVTFIRYPKPLIRFAGGRKP